MVRMLPSSLPVEGVVVMAEVTQIGPNRPRVQLLEYDNIVAKVDVDSVDGCTRRILPLTVGRIEPMLVIKRRTFEKARMRSIIVSRNVSADAMVLCERDFVSRKFVKSVLSICASKTGNDLENIYKQLNWPDSLDTLEHTVSTLHTHFPPHLRYWLNTTLRVMSFSTWRLRDHALLSPTREYQNGWCWAVAVIRQFECLLKICGLLPPHSFLSVQSLVLQTPSQFLLPDGDISSLSRARHGLIAGVTTERFCPQGSQVILPGAPLYKLKTFNVLEAAEYHGADWDRMLDEFISVSPVAASVVWFDSYENMNASEHIFKPTEHEQKIHARNRFSNRFCKHTMLFTGSYVDQNGTPFLEFQDTVGGDINNGDRGYLRFARYPCSVRDMVAMQLLASTEYPPMV